MGDLWPFSLLFRSLFLKDCSNLPPMDLKRCVAPFCAMGEKCVGRTYKKIESP